MVSRSGNILIKWRKEREKEWEGMTDVGRVKAGERRKGRDGKKSLSSALWNMNRDPPENLQKTWLREFYQGCYMNCLDRVTSQLLAAAVEGVRDKESKRMRERGVPLCEPGLYPHASPVLLPADVMERSIRLWTRRGWEQPAVAARVNYNQPRCASFIVTPSTVQSHKPHFLAVHCQEVGGKNYEASMSHVDTFVKELLSSDTMKEYNRARIYLDENYKSQEHFTILNPSSAHFNPVLIEWITTSDNVGGKRQKHNKLNSSLCGSWSGFFL
ncbi:unnamed protein product [Pleuronectes platessa]|uniref:Uncharacterized protein n=1 Tax=Pleuronectes platessa TaxID=8262 RepID=A0A9N7V8A6_PLEPL|nr:unnamed protein product [Pleuronectes platessa]